jgi:ATP-dependent protease Clp ATPase subunit
VIDVAELAETNWAGHTLADALGALYRAANESVPNMRRAVVVLDEVDKTSTHGLETSSLAYRIGKQTSLIPLLGGAPVAVRIGDTNAPTVTWRADRALIIAAGTFSMLGFDGAVTPERLVRAGFMPELVERFGEVLTLEPLTGAALRRVLGRGLLDTRELFALYGYRLAVSPEALDYAAARIRSGRFGPRSALAWLRAAAHRGLLELIDRDANADVEWRLTPDELSHGR